MDMIKEKIPCSFGKSVKINKASLIFMQWVGVSIKNTCGGKPLINYKGKPLFAELAVLRMFQNIGWDGVWVDNYRKRFRTELPEKQDGVVLPDKQTKVLNKIISINGGLNGCWDVFAWKGNKIIFAETKRVRKDAIRASQKKWLKSALKAGIPLKSFLLVEWDFRKE